MRIKDLLISSEVAILTPEFVSAGAPVNGGSGTTDRILNIPMPPFLEAGNLLVAVFTNRTIMVTNGINSGLSTDLAEWTQLGVFASSTAGEFGLLDVWYKFSNGSEPTIPVVYYLNGSSNVKTARVYQFRNVGTIEGGGFAAGKYQATTISPISLTTTRPKSLAVSFTIGISSGTLGAYAGATGGTWTEPVEEYSTTVQNGTRTGINIADMPTIGTISGGSMAASSNNASFSFILGPSMKSRVVPIRSLEGQVAYVNSNTGVGTGAASTNTISGIAYPGAMTVGNLLLLICTNRDRTNVPVSPPAGWLPFLLWNPNPSNNMIDIFYRIVDGSESGTISIVYPVTDTKTKTAQMYQFTECEITPEAVVGTQFHASTAAHGSVSSTRPKSLAVSIVESNGAGASLTYTGAVGGIWSTANGFLDSLGGGTSWSVQIATMTKIGTISGGTTPKTNNITLSFVLNPKYI